MRPQSTFGGKDLYLSLFDKAAAMMHSLMRSLIMNHAFVDENKQTGVVSAIVFLELNGYRLTVADNRLIQVALRMRQRKWDIERLASWLKKHARKIR